MSKNDFEDDFAPVPNNENDLEPEHMDLSDSREMLEEIDIPEFSAKKVKKFNIKGFIFIFAIIISLLLLYLFSSSENKFIKTYRTNFTMNIKMIDSRLGISKSINSLFGNDSQTDELKKREENRAMGMTYDNESYLIPFENAGNTRYEVTDNGVIAAKSNYIALIDSLGKTEWELVTSVVNPILCVEGKYILIAEAGGTKLCLYDGNTLIYAVDAQNEILNANISSAGDAVVVTKKEFYKGAIEVFNKSGDRIYSWSSGAETIICADISPSSRRIAVGFLNTSDQTKGSIQFFNIKDSNSYKTVEIPDTVVFKLEFSGEALNVFGDNRICGLTVHGKVSWDENFGAYPLVAFSIDEKGNKVLLVEQDNVPVIKIYSKGGAKKEDFPIEELPEYVDISGDRLLYNNTRMVIFGKAGKTKKYAAAMDIKNLKIVDNNIVLIVYSNSIEFVKL